MGGRAARPRQERSVQQIGLELESEFLQALRNTLPTIQAKLIEDVERNPEARSEVLDLLKNSLVQARSGRASQMMLALAELRSEGSPILEKLWATLYRNNGKTFASGFAVDDAD